MNATQTQRNSCEGCRNDLGGGCCRMNVEGECREGGGFELWEDEGNGVEGDPGHA